MRKAIIVSGPTGVGKTRLAMQIANKFDGDLISADSIQIYKGCDIISGKDMPTGSKFIKKTTLPSSSHLTIGYYILSKINVFLLDATDPTYSFNASDYLKLVKKVIKIFEKNKKLPIIVGGSTLYINTLLKGIDTSNVPPDKKLRQSLNKLSKEELQNRLKSLSPKKLDSLNNSDRNNARRLIRAIEIAKSDKKTKKTPGLKNYKFKIIGLTMPRERLNLKIENRVDERLQQGALIEARKLFADYSNLSESIKKAKGYKELFAYLNNKTSYKEAVRKWKQSEIQLVKKQFTFLKRNSSTEWFDVSDSKYPKNVLNQVQSFMLNT